MDRSLPSWLWIFLTVFTLACGASRSSPPRAPGDRVAPTLATGPWTFSLSPGTRSYRISRTASIQGIADSALRRETVSNLTHEILTLEPAGEELGFTVVVDTFALTTEGAVGPAQQVELPIHVSGAVSPSGMRINSSPSMPCNAALTTVVTDLHNLLTPLPARFTKGMTWRDSTSVSGCQAGIPITTVTHHTFRVTGEVTYSNQSMILIQRTDSLSAHGGGAYNQHRMLVDGTGVGSALYYLDIAAGEITWLTTTQNSQIRVTTSGRLHSFTQSTNQEFVRVR